MPEFRVRISPAQADDIAVACALGPAKLANLAAAVDLPRPTIRKDLLEARLANHVGEQQSASLTRLALGLCSLSSRDVDQIPDVIDGVGRTLKANFSDEHRFANWGECRDALIILLRSGSVFLTAKAIDVSYDFERVLTSSRIITSIRPIFNIDRSKILGSSIVQTLRLEYISSSENQDSISIALDKADMNALKNACVDGLRKAGVAQSTIENDWELEVTVAGETE